MCAVYNLFSGDCWHWCANFLQGFRRCGYREYGEVSELVLGITMPGIKASSPVTVAVVVVVVGSRCARDIGKCAELVAVARYIEGGRRCTRYAGRFRFPHLQRYRIRYEI